MLIGVHVLALIHLAHWKISGRSLSPLEPSEARETLELGYINAGFVLLVLLVLATLVVGRFFCGWACHVVAYQDAAAWLLGKLSLRPRPLRSRLLLGLPFLAAFDMFALPLIARWMQPTETRTYEWHLTSGDLWQTFPGPWITALTFLVDGFLLIWFLGSKGFCTYGCPYGALFGIAERAAPGRIRVTDDCEGCGQCTVACTSNVRVHAEVAHFGSVLDPSCMRCMDCVSVCPKEALYFGFKKTGQRKRQKGGKLRRPNRVWDFSWREELVLGATALVGVFAFRGLYHSVPLMLALGLGVLLAISVLTLGRLVRAHDLQVQHAILRRSGRMTRAGIVTAVCLSAFIGFSLHSLLVRSVTRAGVGLVAGAESLAPGEREEQLARAAIALTRAEDLGLFPDAELQYHLGLIELHGGRYADAASRLKRTTHMAPRMRAPYLALAEAHMKLGALAGADEALSAYLEFDPKHVRARWRRAQLLIMGRDFVAAEERLESLVQDAPEHAAARRDLERVRVVLGR